jgi:uncharacterized repeat protein (TIGR01451 family)
VDEKIGKGALKLDASGPPTAFINNPVTYTFTLTNTGKGVVTRALIGAMLPPKTEFVKASEGGRFAENQVAWFLGTLQPGAQRQVTLTIKALAAGEICILPFANADDNLTATAEVCTRFTGASALKLEMDDDPRDPIAVGEQTKYKILVTNQGGTPLTNIRVTAKLPAGTLEFAGADGPVKHQLAGDVKQGQIVTFDALPTLAAGTTQRYEVSARALAPARPTVFRVEVTADQLKAGGPVGEDEATTIIPALNGSRRTPRATDGVNTSRPKGVLGD